MLSKAFSESPNPVSELCATFSKVSCQTPFVRLQVVHQQIVHLGLVRPFPTSGESGFQLKERHERIRTSSFYRERKKAEREPHVLYMPLPLSQNGGENESVSHTHAWRTYLEPFSLSQVLKRRRRVLRIQRALFDVGLAYRLDTTGIDSHFRRIR